jgi:hypothetical protein
MKLHTDQQVQPVAQSVWRTAAFSLTGKIEEKFDELLRGDIIKNADGPMNPVVGCQRGKVRSGHVWICRVATKWLLGRDTQIQLSMK